MTGWAVSAFAVVAVWLAPALAAPCPEIPPVCEEAEGGQLRLLKRASRVPTLKWRAQSLDIAMDALADPSTTASYSFCLYAGTAEALIMGFDIPAGDHWRTGEQGVRYWDKRRSLDGLELIKASPGSLDDARLLVKAKGDELHALGFPFDEAAFPILIQLSNDEQQMCWETTFEKERFARNSANRRGTVRSSATLKPERCRDDGGCAVERPLVGAALCRDRVAAGGGMAKRMKIKMGDIIRCRGREAVGNTDGECTPDMCPHDDPACAMLDTNLQAAVMRAIGHYQTKLDLACDDISVAAVQEGSGWGVPCGHARTVPQLMDCLENGSWGEYGNMMGDAIFGDDGVIDPDLLRCRKQLGKQTQKFSSKFNTQLHACRRSPVVRGRPCTDDPIVASQVIYDNYVAKIRASCSDAQIAALAFGPPCRGARTVDAITACLGGLARTLGSQGVALSYP